MYIDTNCHLYTIKVAAYGLLLSEQRWFGQFMHELTPMGIKLVTLQRHISKTPLTNVIYRD